MNESLESNAAGGLEEFASAILRLAPKHDRQVGITDRDADQVSFHLDGYPFTLSWEVFNRPCIGRTVPVVQFALCIWHQTHGSYWDPPEDVDTTLVESQSVYDCIRVALETVAKEEIRLSIENDGYDQMAKEEETV